MDDHDYQDCQSELWYRLAELEDYPPTEHDSDGEENPNG